MSSDLELALAYDLADASVRPLPRGGTFTGRGGPHYGFDKFQHIATMPFQPNTLFAFVKIDNSFHGAEPVNAADIRRRLLT